MNRTLINVTLIAVILACVGYLTQSSFAIYEKVAEYFSEPAEEDEIVTEVELKPGWKIVFIESASSLGRCREPAYHVEYVPHGVGVREHRFFDSVCGTTFVFLEVSIEESEESEPSNNPPASPPGRRSFLFRLLCCALMF